MPVIAVIAIGYQCPNLLGVLQPWFKIKDLGIDLDICCVSALFKERWERGELYANSDNSSLLAKLDKNDKLYSFIEHTKPILDFEAREIAWKELQKSGKHYDFVWQLDLFDEYYTIQEIQKALMFISSSNNQFIDYFRINFKNYFGVKGEKWIDDFDPIRIINNKRRGGVDCFHWDNEVTFKDGSRTDGGQLACAHIPKHYCHPKHLSWVGTPDFLKAKIDYQKRALGVCSYKWDETAGDITFDKDYYMKYKGSLPEVYE